MTKTIEEVKHGLRRPILIPLVPWHDYENLDVDTYGHNLRIYDDRMRRNTSDEPVTVCPAGTSKMPYLSDKHQILLMEATREALGDRATILVGLFPSQNTLPLLHDLEEVVDGGMLMPVGVLKDPKGVFEGFSYIAERSKKPLVLYLRDDKLLQTYMDLLAGHENIVGVKVATKPSDILDFKRSFPDRVFSWGKGEESVTAAYENGADSHTTGLGLVVPGVSYWVRKFGLSEDFKSCKAIEDVAKPFEDVRGIRGMAYNVPVIQWLLQQEELEHGLRPAKCIPFSSELPRDLQDTLKPKLESLKPYI
tara:strand:- start:1074 stop:1994 length:921 start_codon:yes stop_codon:yes gene_type:complete